MRSSCTPMRSGPPESFRVRLGSAAMVTAFLQRLQLLLALRTEPPMWLRPHRHRSGALSLPVPDGQSGGGSHFVIEALHTTPCPALGTQPSQAVDPSGQTSGALWSKAPSLPKKGHPSRGKAAGGPEPAAQPSADPPRTIPSPLTQQHTLHKESRVMPDTNLEATQTPSHRPSARQHQSTSSRGPARSPGPNRRRPTSRLTHGSPQGRSESAIASGHDQPPAHQEPPGGDPEPA